MEVVHNNQEEILMGSNEYLHVVKGKRTKRQRPLSPLTLPAMTTSTSSSGGGGGGGEQRGDNNFPSPTTSVEFSGISSEEEEDMANCLILLAQGGHTRSKQIDDHVDDENGKMARINSRGFYNDAAAATTSKAAAGAGAGLYLYECKTCNKCFSSFQALGGHRASHKRPNKSMCNEEAKTTITKTSSLLMLTELESPRHHQFNDNSNNNNIASSTTSVRPSLVLQMGNSSLTNVYNNNKSRVHECSICGSEFSSGQALGGHMRRHRTSNASATTTTASTNIDFSHHQDELNFSKKKPRNVLSLDLNLPAPEEDYHHRESSKFSLFGSSKQQPLVFSASALVDCHY